MALETEHVVHVADARDGVGDLPDDSVDLVVTSPPYPMVEMWDDLFRSLDPAIAEALDAGDGERAFGLMHEALAAVWDEVARVLAPGGIACVNVGDATRTVDGDDFALYPNHTELAARLHDAGLMQLPGVVWRKPVNRATKFMGSGMLPTNAYPTLEHEHVLVFRNGGPRSLPPGDDARYESAYFWEERNDWFSDLWTLAGETQALSGTASDTGDPDVKPDDDPVGDPVAGGRERSGAFPLSLPLRLIRMFSVRGDRVLDPFWGTGTTTVAAMLTGRSSVGYELDDGLVASFDDRLAGLTERSGALSRERLARHAAWAADRDDLGYDAEHYDFRVMTKQERRIREYAVESVERLERDTSDTSDTSDASDASDASGREGQGAPSVGALAANGAGAGAGAVRYRCVLEPVEF